jgi:hypothetical protein
MSVSKREKSYSQHYRKKWEQIPQLRGAKRASKIFPSFLPQNVNITYLNCVFAGWLSEAPSTNPDYAKAFCKYCQKKLVPHVTGLLKHGSCRNHLKAAKDYVDKINAAVRRAQEKVDTKLMAILRSVN